MHPKETDSSQAIKAPQRFVLLVHPIIKCVPHSPVPCKHKVYLRRPTEESVEQGKIVAVFYTTVIPMLNPMIYSLRNKDVKEAVNKVIIKANLGQ